jgi:hypothetical protein
VGSLHSLASWLASVSNVDSHDFLCLPISDYEQFVISKLVEKYYKEVKNEKSKLEIKPQKSFYDTEVM